MIFTESSLIIFNQNLLHRSQIFLVQQQISFPLLALRFFTGNNPNFLFQQSALQTSGFFLFFQNSLEFCRAYIPRYKLGKHQTPLLLFRRLIFSTPALAFSHRTLLHSTQLSFFPQRTLPAMESEREGW